MLCILILHGHAKGHNEVMFLDASAAAMNEVSPLKTDTPPPPEADCSLSDAPDGRTYSGLTEPCTP